MTTYSAYALKGFPLKPSVRKLNRGKIANPAPLPGGGVPPPPTTTQPVPTYAPNQLPYRTTTDYVWSNFNNNATCDNCIIECASSHEALPFDPTCKPWGGKQCTEKTNECLGNGPLGMGTSVILRNTSTFASSKVNSICTFITMCNNKFYNVRHF